LADAGVPGYDSGVWYGVLAPLNTPREIVMRLNADLLKVLRHPEFRTLMQDNGIEPMGTSPKELASYIRSEIVKWAKVVKQAKLKVE